MYVVDIDECLLNSHSCSASQRCVNTPGSFTCEALPQGSGPVYSHDRYDNRDTQGTEAVQSPSGTCLTGYAYNQFTQNCEGNV